MPNTPHISSSQLHLPSARNLSLKRHVTVSLTVAEPGTQPPDNPEAPADTARPPRAPSGRSSGRCPLGGGAAGAEDGEARAGEGQRGQEAGGRPGKGGGRAASGSGATEQARTAGTQDTCSALS